METVSVDFTLKPSLQRIFLGDLLIFLFAYLMALISRAIDPCTWFPRDLTGQGLILLVGMLSCLLVGGLESEKMTVRLAGGRLEGRAPFSWKPVSFPLAGLDREKTRQSLRESIKSKAGLLKRSYLWSMNGERIEFRAKAFEQVEVEAFFDMLGVAITGPHS